MSRPKRIDDETLLQATTDVFWRQGFAATGIRELEAATGLKAPALYHRFGSKEALFVTTLGFYIERVVGRRIRHYLQGERYAGAPLTGLRAFFDSTYDYLGPDTPPLACLVVNTSLEGLSADPAIAALLEDAGSRVRDAFADTLRRACMHGQLSPSCDVMTTADVLHLGLQGLLVTSKVTRDKKRLSRHVDHLFSMLPAVCSEHNPSQE